MMISGSNSKPDPLVLYSFQKTKLKVKRNMHFQKYPRLIFYKAASGKILWRLRVIFSGKKLREDQTTQHESEEIPYSRQKNWLP